MADGSDISKRIETYILEEFDPDMALTADLPLRESGVFDSADIMEFIAFLEEEFDIFVEDDEMVAATFQSIGSTAAFVEQKLAEGG